MLYVRLVKSCLVFLGLLCLFSGLVIAQNQLVVEVDVTEDDDSLYPGFLYASGQLTAAENGYIETVSIGDYGYFFLNNQGIWAYLTEKKRVEIQRLGEGDRLTESFSVSDVDGVISSVVVNIKGVNDKAEISGVNTGIVWEDKVGQSRVLRVSGRLEISDADADEAFFIASSLSGRYGRLRINSAGVWVYKVKNSLAMIQSLADGDFLTESFVVNSLDFTSHEVTVTIKGVNDAAQVSGVDVGIVTEDRDDKYKGYLYAEGQLEVIDSDSGESGFVEEVSVGSHGYFYLNDAGEWAYLGINSQREIQFLSSGEVLEESFSVSTIDGTNHDVVIQIQGIDEISGALKLSWTAPFSRENGDALLAQDIAGYRMYYGLSSGDYIFEKEVNGATDSLSIGGLLPATYYLVMTAYDSAGRESRYSDEHVVTVR